MNIAQTILAQLGGNKFVVMTGAKNFMNHGSALSFRLPSNFATDGINYIKITLNGSDLYDIEYKKIRGTTVKDLGEENNVFCEDLKRFVSEKTGLSLSL